MSETIAWFTPGTPITKGSGTPMVSASGKLFVRQNNRKRLGPWQDRIEAAAIEAGVRKIFSEDKATPYRVDRAFFIRRPRSHFKGDGLKPNAPRRPTFKKADIDKLTRGVLDALTGCVYVDDSQVVEGEESKSYCDAENPQPGVWIGVRVV